jgi:hypothetical protein
MIRKSIAAFAAAAAAFAAAAAAFAVGAPVASAAVTSLPLSAVQADGSVSFSYTVPAGTAQSAILVDLDSNGESDYAISTAIDAVDGNIAIGASTSGSTQTCQQYYGPDMWDDPWELPVTVTPAGADDLVTISTDGDERLQTAFTAKAVAFGEDFEDVCEPDSDTDTLRVATNMTGASSFDFTRVAPVAPAAPTNLKAVAGDGQVELTWDAVSDAENYNIIVDGEPIHFGYDGTAFTVGDLVNGQTYSFQVEARNEDGTSERSAAVLATPQAPVVGPRPLRSRRSPPSRRPSRPTRSTRTLTASATTGS